MSSDLISVVIPARDRPDYLERALLSIFERQAEIPQVVVSDNSTRDFPEMERLRRRYPFSYVRQTGNLTMFEHHSACMKLSATPWAFLLHDDDELYPGAVDTLTPLLADAGGLGAIVG